MYGGGGFNGGFQGGYPPQGPYGGYNPGMGAPGGMYPGGAGYGSPQMGMGYGMQPGMGMGMQPGMGMGMQPGMGMGMQPGMGMGMGAGMGGNYGYRNRNWAGYNMNRYAIPQHYIQNQSQMAFQMYDRNGSGFIEMYEVPMVINDIFMRLGLGLPDPDDVEFCMYEFDRNGDGRLNYMEFVKMLRYLSDAC